MAKLIAPFQLSGSIGDLTFYSGEDGKTLVKSKSSPRKWQMKHGEAFARSRLCNAEWKTATGATRIFRLAMGDLKMGVNDRRLAGRMNSWLLAAVRSDQVNDWGNRRLQSCNLSMLEGFEFNHQLKLADLLPFNPDECWQADDRQVRASLPGFRLRRADKQVPSTATHFRMVSAMVYVDFNKKIYTRVIEASAMTAVGRKSIGMFTASHEVVPLAGRLSFWLLGVEFYRVQDDQLVAVKGGALRVMKVWDDGAADNCILLNEHEPASVSTIQTQPPMKHPHSASEPLLLAPGEGRVYNCGAMTAMFKADENETAEKYSVSEWWLKPHSDGPGAHDHEANDEVFYVLEGTVSFLVGDQWVDASKGAFLRIPARTLHDFKNNTDQPAGVLNFFIPGGFERNMPAIVKWFEDNP